MLIMVANKKKLKRIIIGVVVALLAIGGIIFGVVKNHSTPTFNIIDEASLPYERGTKANSGYVAMTCNVEMCIRDSFTSDNLYYVVYTLHSCFCRMHQYYASIFDILIFYSIDYYIWLFSILPINSIYIPFKCRIS